MNITDKITITNECNLELMKRYPDGYFDLAIVDPPYGIGEDGASNHSRSRLENAKMYKDKGWDNEPPTVEFFIELKRVSKNQIIWGANHFIERVPEANTPSWIVWDKMNGENYFADCELAYTSHGTAVRKFCFRWAGMLQGNMKDKEKRIHPTQKPVALYRWTLQKYAKKGFKVLDTHLGSASQAIAVHELNEIEKMDLEFYGCELDPDYFNDSVKRITNHIGQQKLF